MSDKAKLEEFFNFHILQLADIPSEFNVAPVRFVGESFANLMRFNLGSLRLNSHSWRYVGESFAVRLRPF